MVALAVFGNQSLMRRNQNLVLYVKCFDIVLILYMQML